jgi:hypothetical protein
MLSRDPNHLNLSSFYTLGWLNASYREKRGEGGGEHLISVVRERILNVVDKVSNITFFPCRRENTRRL